jgi:hypothetical protein
MLLSQLLLRVRRLWIVVYVGIPIPFSGLLSLSLLMKVTSRVLLHCRLRFNYYWHFAVLTVLCLQLVLGLL